MLTSNLLLFHIIYRYISNSLDDERVENKIKYTNSITNNNNNSLNVGLTTTSSTAVTMTPATSSGGGSGKTSLFSRKSKWKEELRNLKNSRLQLPLKAPDLSASGNQPITLNSGNISSNNNQSSNSLFYINPSDLNATTPPTSSDNIVNSQNQQSLNIAGLENDNKLLVDGANNSIGDGMGDGGSALSLKNKQRLLDKIRELGLNFFNEDFEGITVSTTKCLSCETVTEQKETMIDIAVPVPQNGYESNEYNNRSGSFIQV